MSAPVLKFIDSSAETFDHKRRQPPPRACDSCRRKKKRCKHATEPDSHSRKNREPDLTSGDKTKRRSTRRIAVLSPEEQSEASDAIPVIDFDEATIINPATSLDQEPSTHQEGRPDGSPTQNRARIADSHFIGDLNPEGIFLAATSPHDVREEHSDGRVGIWLAQRLQATHDNLGRTKTAPPSSLLYGLTPAVQQFVFPILESECMQTLPPTNHRDIMSAIYFKNFHTILPIIDEDSYGGLEVDRPDWNLLTQGICLLASFDPEVQSHLFLGDDRTLLGCQEFGRRILGAMRLSIEIGLVTDRSTLIRALALMSHFVEGREGADLSSLMIGRAIQLLHSLGLHQQSLTDNDHQPSASTTLFCCIWAQDRLNAAFHGKPVLMHEIDIGKSLKDCFAAQEPVFRLFLEVVDLLDKVIDIYRPGAMTQVATGEFKIYDDLILDCEAAHIPANQLCTIEVLYHAICILSCRTSFEKQDNPGSSVGRIRQALSAERLRGLVQDLPKALILFPFIPYAISLSLSLNYKEMRRSKIPSSRNRARLSFEADHQALKRLGGTFWSASMVAQMAGSIVEQMDKAYTQLANDGRIPQNETSVTNGYAVPATTQIQPYQPINAFGADADGFSDPNFAYSTDMPDLNIFDMFEPDFDLDGFDAYLEGNLDLGMPAGILA